MNQIIMEQSSTNCNTQASLSGIMDKKFFNKNKQKQILIQNQNQYDNHFNQDDSNSKTIGFSQLNSIKKNNKTPFLLTKKIKAQVQEEKQYLQDNLDDEVTFKSMKKKLIVNNILQDDQKTQLITRKVKGKKVSLSQCDRTNDQQLKLSQITFIGKNQQGNQSLQQHKNQVIASAIKETLSKPSPHTSLPPLRQKFSSLLPSLNRLSLSYQHHQLLKILSIIDQTILFSSQNRSTKSVFLEDLKKRIRDSLRVFIQLHHIEQLMYLDQNVYNIKWQWSYNKKGYDLMIGLDKVGGSKDERKNKIRKVMIEFLKDRHQEFLNDISKNNTNNNLHNINYTINSQSWHPSFSPDSYSIPRRSLPPHPQTQKAELRCIQPQQLQSIKNKTLQNLIKQHKQKSQIFSYNKQKSMIDMMFNKKMNSKQYQKVLMEKVKEKEVEKERLQIERKNREIYQEQAIQPKILIQLAQQILYIYISKSVSNLFKIKLIQLLNDRIRAKYSQKIVNRHFQYLIRQMKQISFLKEIITSNNKPIIVQINRNKINQVKQYANKINNNNKQIVI